jgi:hypothetical protein
MRLVASWITFGGQWGEGERALKVSLHVPVVLGCIYGEAKNSILDMWGLEDKI